jgi:7-cyano-7-deazaguanine reductase
MKKTTAPPSSKPASAAATRSAARPGAHPALETFPNPAPARDYLVRIEVPEFTCLCPITGQPDFARFVLEFVPDRRNVELKSLKLYVYGYRDQGAFHEAVTNRVLDDLVAAMAPRYLRVTALWNVRGGIYTSVVVEHRKRGWKPAPAVTLGAAERVELPHRAPGL